MSTPISPTTDELRNADLPALSAALTDQRARSIDVVVPARTLRSAGARLVLSGIAPQLDDDGVTEVNGAYNVLDVATEGLSSKLDVPTAYLRRLRNNRPDLFDATVNGFLLGGAWQTEIMRGHGVEPMPGQIPSYAADPRRFLLRLLRHASAEADSAGTVRAVLSDGYRSIDNLDVVLAALAGIQSAPGIDVSDLTVKADLTARRMYVRITSTAIAAQAQALVRDYRDPHTGRLGRDYPLMFAGLVISNSEVGDGAMTVTPRVVLQVCTNGQTITKDALRKVHAGAKLDDGVQWSQRTHDANLELIRSQTADAVAQFMSTTYVQRVVDELASKAGIELAEPAAVVETVSKRLGFTGAQAADILSAFIKGADTTAGGLMHAVTYVAQQQSDGDAASALEDAALPALQLAAASASVR